jgi:hypothetical protein
VAFGKEVEVQTDMLMRDLNQSQMMQRPTYMMPQSYTQQMMP